MRAKRLILLIGLATLQFAGARIAIAAEATLSVGQNLAGETCNIETILTEAQEAGISCGDGTAIVGSLRVANLTTDLPADLAARREALFARARTIVGGRALSQQLSCDAGRLLAPATDGDALLFLCTAQSNSMPRIMLISAFGRSVFQAEGLPGMLAVLGVAITNASGQQVSPVEIATGQDFLASRLPANVLKSATSEISRYTQLVELARAYGSGNNYGEAETALRNALDIEIKLFGPDSAPVGLGLMELALQVSNQSRFEEAGELFRRSAPIVQALLGADARARLNSYLALDAANQRDFPRALEYARFATDDRRAELEAANGPGGIASGFEAFGTISRGELAHSLRLEAELALRLDDLATAQTSAEEALWIISLEPGLPLSWRADALTLMAQVNERRGRIAAAERNYADAIALKEKLFGDSVPTANTRLRAGRFYADQQLYPQALAQFRAAIAILSADTGAGRRITPDQIVPLIATATSMTATPEERTALDAESFRASQFAASDIADQTIVRASARLAAGNPALAELIGQMQEAQRARDNARINLAVEFAKPNDERVAEQELQLAGALTLASGRADDLLARVAQTFPDYAKLANPEPVSLPDVAAKLRTGEGLLSFVVGHRGSYGLLLTRDGLTVHKLDVTIESLEADIAELRRAFVPVLGQLPEFPLDAAHALYVKLLAPFAGQLAGIDHLIVAPGASLANLPFSLLVTAPPSDTGNYSNAAWLIRKMAVSNVPSPRAFLLLREAVRTRQAAPMPFLGFGDPVLLGPVMQRGNVAALDALARSCREAGPISADLLRILPPLHDTAAEVSAAASALGGRGDSILLGANASEANLRGRALDQYGVLYFATHGLLPGELHCQAEPGLVLSPPQQTAQSTDADGILEAGEIAGLRLNADLIVLSACNTASVSGERFGGGALEGLADAFFNAGARAVLASHWEIPSAATTELMTGVFQRYGLDRTRDLAEALRQSQLAMTNSPTAAHPYNWAAFTLIGVSEGPEIVAANTAPQ